jgi:uncharacterized protein YjbI with pentapeptide repeats
MANNDHLAIIKQGVSKWNTWRSEEGMRRLVGHDKGNFGVIGVDPDLSEANLSRTDLRGVNLSYSDLRGANLSKQ